MGIFSRGNKVQVVLKDASESTQSGAVKALEDMKKEYGFSLGDGKRKDNGYKGSVVLSFDSKYCSFDVGILARHVREFDPESNILGLYSKSGDRYYPVSPDKK